MKIVKNLIFVMLPILILACTKTKEEQIKALDTQITEKRTKIKEVETELDEIIAKRDSLKGEKEEKFPVVNALSIKLEDFESFVKVHGVVSTDKNITVVPEGSGVIRSISVRRGQVVRQGQVLASIDADVINKNIKELEKSLEFATTLFEKQKKLHDQNIGTEVQFLEAKNRKEGIEQSIKTLKSQRSKYTIRAPISGKIDEIFPNVGEMASQVSPFARIVNTNNVYVESDVSEAFVNQVKIGDEVHVKFPFSEDLAKVKISYKSNFINPANRTFKVHASLVGVKENFVPNMLTILKIRDQYMKDAIVVNNTSIYTDIKGDYVFLLEKEKEKYKTKKVYITRGSTYQNRSVISGKGIKKGDLLITERYQTLDEGDVVTLKK